MRSGWLAALGLLPATLLPLITAAVLTNAGFFLMHGPAGIFALLPILGPLLLALGCLWANTRPGLVLAVCGFIVLGGFSLILLLFQLLGGVPEAATGLATVGAGVGAWGALRILREDSAPDAPSARLVRAGFATIAVSSGLSVLSLLVLALPSLFAVGMVLISGGYALAAYAYPEPTQAPNAQPTTQEAAPRL